MNNSNNVLGNNNNVKPTTQPININGVNSTPQPSNSTINVNSMIDDNMLEVNSTPTQQPENFNSQINKPIPNNNINQTTTNNIIPMSQSINYNIPPQQSLSSASLNDKSLLKAFIGNNYEKITTKQFNIAAFFFNSLYMCYRKMFGYGILTWLAYLIMYNVINTFAPSLSFILSIGLCVVVGLFANKIYLSYAQKKILIIKASNPQMNNEELKTICAAKGGTSVGKIFLGLLTQFGIALVVLFIMVLIGIGGAIGNLFNPNNWNITANNENGTSETNSGSNLSSTINGTLLENVSINGYTCFGSKCNVTINSSNGNSEDYDLEISNSDFFTKLEYYKDYIKLNIYYNEKESSKTIVGYKIYLKSNNEDISNVSKESELRDKIGLYSLGTHTETLTLLEIGTTYFTYDDDESDTYIECTFVDSNNIEYEMECKNDKLSNLTEGKQYTVTFEVSKGIFNYDYYIQSIK